jgi:hypothetical protein
MATGYVLDDQGVGVRVPVGPRPALGPTQQPIQRVRGKAARREADHSPVTSAEVKKTWIYTSSPIRLHGVLFN